MSSCFCVKKTTFRASDCILTKSGSRDLDLDTQKQLLTLQIAAPQGITVSSNVATVAALLILATCNLQLATFNLQLATAAAGESD